MSNRINKPKKTSKEIVDMMRDEKGISFKYIEFVTMLYVYNEIVTEKVKHHHLEELKDLFFGRMIEKKSFFAENALIKNSYSFACIMIENLVK